MTSSVAFWLVLAVLLFWSLGAYNRLVRLRARVLGRFAQVDQHMVQALALLGDAARVPVGPTVANPATRLEATLPAAPPRTGSRLLAVHRAGGAQAGT